MKRLLTVLALAVVAFQLSAQSGPQVVAARELIMRASNSQCRAAGGSQSEMTGNWIPPQNGDYRTMMRAIPQRLRDMIIADIKYDWQVQDGWMSKPQLSYQDRLGYYVTVTQGFCLDNSYTEQIVAASQRGQSIFGYRLSESDEINYADVLRHFGYR